jgi:hypothetical protein
VKSTALFVCRYPLGRAVSFRMGDVDIPILDKTGLAIMGERPWLLSTWLRGELAARVTGPAATRGVDLGASFGFRGILRQHLALGGRGDVLVDSDRGTGQFIAGPEVGYVNKSWPCSRCSVEANLSYFVGYSRGFAHGPEADLRFGVRLVRGRETWHGVDLSAGYRHLIGPESGGSVVFMLSYNIETAIRSALMPKTLRAKPHELAESAQAETPNEQAD